MSMHKYLILWPLHGLRAPAGTILDLPVGPGPRAAVAVVVAVVAVHIPDQVTPPVSRILVWIPCNVS